MIDHGADCPCPSCDDEHRRERRRFEYVLAGVCVGLVLFGVLIGWAAGRL